MSCVEPFVLAYRQLVILVYYLYESVDFIKPIKKYKVQKMYKTDEIGVCETYEPMSTIELFMGLDLHA